MASKIKVDTIENVAGSGNVSLGSGHNLVVPGNNTTSGNATVGGTLGVTGASTLTGDLTVDTSTLKVDSSNNRVGVGNASPLAVLDVKGNTDTFGTMAKVYLTDSNSNSASRNWSVGNGGSAHGSFTISKSKLKDGNPSASGTADNTLIIDNLGRVTTPLQPSFSVRSNAGNNGNTWEAGQDIKFQLVDRNNGSHYATGTGRFTAPVAGFYHFNYSGFGYSAGRVPAAGTASVQLRKNGTAVITGAYVEVNTSTGYPNCNFAFSLLLAVNDYVTIRAQSQGQYADSSGLYTAFSGFLVG